MYAGNDQPDRHAPRRIRRRDDVEGCGCLRCQRVEHAAVRRSLPGAFAWSVRFVRRRPSTFGVVVAVGITQLLALQFAPEPATTSAVVGVVGLFLARGYVGVLASGRLTASRWRDRTATAVVASRFPAFLGALAIVTAIVLAAVLVVVVGIPATGRSLATALGLGSPPIRTDVLVLLAAMVAIVALLVKFCFVPDACFVGGYGPLEALRVSWAITTVHRRQALALTIGLLALIGLTVVLDAQFAPGDRPVVLSVTIDGTSVAVRSIGLSTAGLHRLLVDASVSTVYAAAFAHQYVSGVVDPAVSSR